jgi:hypothetical protein
MTNSTVTTTPIINSTTTTIPMANSTTYNNSNN